MPEAVGIPTTIDDARREASRIKNMVTEAVEEGARTAMKAIKQGRIAAEDMIGEAKHTVKSRPFESIGVVFAAGLLTGCILGWLASRED